MTQPADRLACAPLYLAAYACAALLLAHATARAQQAPMPVLTDTDEYCGQLQTRLQSCATRPPEVMHLFSEGRQMCDHGDIRGGIARLRRALMIQKHTRPCGIGPGTLGQRPFFPPMEIGPRPRGGRPPNHP